MGQTPSSSSSLIRRMEGKQVGLDKSVLATSRFSRNNLADAVDSALKHPLPSSILEECFSGLCFDFEKREANVIQEFPPGAVTKTIFVIIHFHGGVLPEGPARVTTGSGFLYLYSCLQEIAMIYGMLKEKHNPKPTKDNGQATGVEECPICMDRLIDTVLSCSHGICKVCEIEWLEGEGRGTCPICRRREKADDDWVLNEANAPTTLDDTDMQSRIEKLTKNLFELLLSFPTFEESMHIIGGEKSQIGESGIQYDGLTQWIKSQLAYLNDIDRKANWAKCPKCTTIVRVPNSAENDTRLMCLGCKGIYAVKDLQAA